MSLSADARATAKAVRLRHLKDADKESDIWLEDVMRKAEILGAVHTIEVECLLFHAEVFNALQIIPTFYSLW